MRWTERQRAMLEAMGLRLWSPVDAAAVDAPGALRAHHDKGAGAVRRASAVAAPRGSEVGVDIQAGGEAGAGFDIGVPGAGTGDVATLDWTSLRRAVAVCTACSLSEDRRQTVFGVGHPRAHWMVVGEAPGEQEDREGEPFVGKSGQLLDNMLRAIGLGRAEPAGGPDPARQVYIANTVKCRPPGNRNPEPGELIRCEAFLARQIALVRPRLVVAMGRVAIQGLLHSNEPLGRLRGRVHRVQGVPVIATYDPAYLLRNLEEKARAWEDLCLAVETMRAETA